MEVFVLSGYCVSANTLMIQRPEGAFKPKVLGSIPTRPIEKVVHLPMLKCHREGGNPAAAHCGRHS